ncbi:uncharacterized protein LOC118194750, partial [Stegodyphus dumicola]|uniref:uncharacterized protein LOC118194750 n=1 Tax=Stegodyphus dumicola TaxID=202533 RepID=UPI0015B0C872
RMHLKGEDGSSGVKVLTGRLASFRSKPGRLIGESTSISTESSADSATPLNKGLPLLQRVRMLGEQERRAAATQGAAPTSPQNGANAPSEIIGEGLPFLERLKLLRAKEQAQAAAAGNGKQTSPKNDRNAKPGQSTLKVETQQKPSLSPKSKHNPFSSLLTSAIPAVSTSPKLLPKVPSPKKETISDGKRSPVGLKARIPEFSTELPLLKKVLLMKMMEDKKTDGSNNATQADIQGANSSAAQAQEDSNGRGSDKNGADASNKNDNATASQDLDPDRVYLEQFSRTLGFHMSQLSEDTPKPQPRARLNALSNTPSPTKENVNPVDSLKEQDTSNKKESKRKSPQPQSRKARLSRMMAVREDSDENSTADDDEDPFVKSTECQTEHFEALRSTSTSPDSVSGREGKIRNPELEDGIQDYLLKVMKNVKHAMKAYVIEQQQQLQKRIIQLEKDSREKDELIKKLRSRLEHQSTRPSSTFDEVSSLEVSSLSSSDADERENTFIENQHGQAEEEDEDEDRDLDDEEIRILQQKLSVQRKSWPSSVNIRRMRLPCTRQSYSLDDEQQIIDISKPEEMWRLEFPAPPSQLPISLRVSPQEPVFETIPERLNEDLPLASEEEEENEDKIDENFPDETLGKSCSAGNDWEVRMLVQQFEQNVRQQSRRHSSGEVLTWDRVLNLRKIASRAEKKSPEKVRSRTGRKYSLIEEGSLRQWAASGSSSGMAQSTSFTSLMGPDSRHGSSTTASGRTVPKSARRKSCGQHKRQEPPSGRKNSLPILPHCSSIGMSRWLSMDDAKSEGCRSHDSSLHTSMSSEYSQETVIGVDSRFSSVDDVRPSEGATLGTRSPSSPNVVTDREPQTSFAFSAASALPEWPSSPCLPTIREDEQSIGAVVVPSASSPCRSLSHDCLPQMSLSTLVGQYHRSGASLKRQTESFHEPRTFSAMPYQRASASDSKVSDLRSRTQSGTNVSLDSKLFSNGKPTTSSSGSRTTLSSLELVRNNQSLSQSSVVIAIPEYEPLLSP